MPNKLFNFIAFQICWFANILGAANGATWIGPVITIAWLIAHFAVLGGPNARRDRSIETHVIIAAMALGWVADSTLSFANLIAFPQGAGSMGTSPMWMVALWACFAATLRHCLGWLQGRWLLGATFGAIGGPLAYLGGQSLGAIALAGNFAIAAVALQYALAIPILLLVVHLSQRFVQDTGERIGAEAHS